jgi:CheY-like chemotaxis protein
MRLNALVMSRSTGSVRVLVTAFAKLGIEYRISFSASETLEMLTSGSHSALVLDFDLPQAAQVAKLARVVEPKRKPLLFGMVGPSTPIGAVFQAGANFVLYKPVDLLQVMHSFRAAQSLMQRDRRRSSRQRSETLAYLQLPTGTIPALVHDLTDQGLAIQAAEQLMPLRGISLRFLLPGTFQVVHAKGDFIWADERGNAGLFFTEIPVACRRDLQAWLRKRGARKHESVRSLLEPQKAQRSTAAS